MIRIEGKAPALWFAIILLGSHLPTFTNINHLFFRTVGKMDKHSESVKPSGSDKGYYFFFCEIVNGIPGARGYICIGDDESSKKWNQINLDILTSFSQTSAGIALASSCWEASNCACAEECDCLIEFHRSMEDYRFVTALINLSRSFMKAIKDLDVILIDQMANTSSNKYYDYLKNLLEASGEEALELNDVIARRKESLRRRPKNANKISTKELITSRWLSKALWNKTSSEILDALPQLSSGETGDDHEKDCRKIDKAIRELGLTRMTAPKS